jgi:hypothetical protein
VTGTNINLGNTNNDGGQVDTNVVIDKNSIEINREGKGGHVGSDDKNKVDVNLKLVLFEAIEYLDEDEDCMYGEGDTILQSIKLGDLNFDVTYTEEVSGGIRFFTVTMTDEQKIFVITFVVAADKYKIGAKWVPAQAARFMFLVNFPFESTKSKIILVFKVVTGEDITLGLDDVSLPGDIAVKRLLGAEKIRVAGLNADGTARIGSEAEVDVVVSPPYESSKTDVALHGDGERVFTINVCVDVVGAPTITYDPVVGAEEYEDPTSDNATAAASSLILSPIVVLLLALCTLFML